MTGVELIAGSSIQVWYYLDLVLLSHPLKTL